MPRTPFLSPEDRLTGGPAMVTLPTAPATPAPTQPPSPAPGSTTSGVVPGSNDGGAMPVDDFVFDEVFLGNGNSPEELFALLGAPGNPSGPGHSIWIAGETTVFNFPEGSVYFLDFPGPLGGSGGTLARDQFVQDFERCLFIADGNIDLCL